MLPAALLAIIFVASNALAAVLVQPPVTVDSLILKEPNYGNNSSELNNSGGSDPNEKLFKAIEKGNVFLVKWAIRSGADVNHQDNGYTPLLRAVYDGKLDIVIVLLESGANVNGTGEGWGCPLYVSSNQGNVEIVKVLLAYGANANVKERIYKTTPLMSASQNAKITDSLLNAGAIVDAVDFQGTTALLKACVTFSGNEDTVLLLINAGADVNWVDKRGLTALKIAKYYFQNKGIADILEAAGARMPPGDLAAGGEQIIM